MDLLTLIIDVLGFYGIRRETVGPLVLAGILFYVFFHRYAARPMNGIQENVSTIKNAVCELQMHISGNDGKKWLHPMKASDYGASHSPMMPNESGQKLLEESGFSRNYGKIKKLVFPILNEMKTRTLYDAEKNSVSALHQVESDPAFDDIKSFIVNKPDERPPIDIIFTVGSWIIRDDYAKEKRIEK